jgi:hypothetical protein
MGKNSRRSFYKRSELRIIMMQNIWQALFLEGIIGKYPGPF